MPIHCAIIIRDAVSCFYKLKLKFIERGYTAFALFSCGLTNQNKPNQPKKVRTKLNDPATIQNKTQLFINQSESNLADRN